MNNSYQQEHKQFPILFIASLIAITCYVSATNVLFSFGEMAPAHTIEIRDEVK